MKSDGKNLRIIRHDTIPLGSKTGRSFTIIKDFGKGKKVKILKQYEINDWAQEENVQKLMALINTDSW